MKKNLILKIGMFFLFGILIINFASSIGEINYCCERLKNSEGGAGAWCQDANDANECYTGINPLTNSKYQDFPTLCDSSGYCKKGTCITSDGFCMPNTPEPKCTKELEGTWKKESIQELDQCKPGCCVLEEESMITTSIKCSTEAANRGLEQMFMENIQDPLECAKLSNLDEKGACVFEQNFQKRCLMLRKKQCFDIMASRASSEIFENYYGNRQSLTEIDSSTVSFQAGSLCSDSSLGTTCLQSKETTEYNGKVYFLDSCKNLANIYDYSKIDGGEDDSEYWNSIKEGNEICSLTWSKNKITNAKTCGNCDMSSIATFSIREATAGNYICQTKDCTDESEFGVKDFYTKYGRYPFDSESWCVEDAVLTKFGLLEEFGIMNLNIINLSKQNLPGTQYYKLDCQNGEVLKPELCMPRADICAETTIDSGKKDSSGNTIKLQYAVCAANVWEDCTLQTNKTECEDSSVRSCDWILGYSIQRDKETKEQSVYEDKNENGERDSNEKFASCVPKIPPATEQLCELASYPCEVKYEKRGFGDVKKTKYCIENCYCIEGFRGSGDLSNTVVIFGKSAREKYEATNPPFKSYADWINSMKNTCYHLGDCGDKKNYLGYPGEDKKNIIDISEIEKA